MLFYSKNRGKAKDVWKPFQDKGDPRTLIGNSLIPFLKIGTIKISYNSEVELG
jgi:hypothetical protein